MDDAVADDETGRGIKELGIKELNVISVRELLEKKLVVPEYQRPYRWTQEDVRTLIDDVREFSRYPEYRIGTVILHKDAGHDPDNQNRLNIVDGQQRIVTLMLVVGVLDEDESDDVADGADRFESNVRLPGSRESRRNIFRNRRAAKAVFRAWTGPERKDFRRFLLGRCAVLEICVDDLAMAFQLFDSQNSRGRELDPTDLLKAFHIREMGMARVPQVRQRDMVARWEAIPEDDVSWLFGVLLYRIRMWSRNQTIRGRDRMSAGDVAMFKGIREGEDHRQDNWAKTLLLAKDAVDGLRREHPGLVCGGLVSGVEYPFQITQPVINGEWFFLMADHYYRLACLLGILPLRGASDRGRGILGFVGDGGDDASVEVEILETLQGWRGSGSAGDRHAGDLFGCVLFHYVDRFGSQEFKGAFRGAFLYAAYLRIRRQRLSFASVNRYVTEGTEVNMFRVIHESLSPRDVLTSYSPEAGIGGGNGRNEELVALCGRLVPAGGSGTTGGRDVPSASSVPGDSPFAGVKTKDELEQRIRMECSRPGYADAEMMFLLLQNTGFIRHADRGRWNWRDPQAPDWFDLSRRRDIMEWLTGIVGEVQVTRDEESEDDGD